MPVPNTGAESDNSANVHVDDTTDSGTTDIDAKINRAIVGHIKRLENRMMNAFNGVFQGDALSKAIDAHLERATQNTTPVEKPNASNSAGEAVTKKALADELTMLRQMVQKEQQARQEAEAKARDASMRGRVQAELARHLGADSPFLDAYMAKLYDRDKRFVDANGNVAITFKRDWGEEPLPLETGVKELFDTELKHLVTVTKTNNLPTIGVQGAVRQPITSAPQQKQAVRPSSLFAEIATGISETRPEAAQILMQDAQTLANQAIPTKK